MIQFVATVVVVLMTILDSVQATPSVRRLSRYSRYWDQATAVDDWIDSLSDDKLSYFQDMIRKGYADALIDTFAAQHDEYGDYYDNDYYEMGPLDKAKNAVKSSTTFNNALGKGTAATPNQLRIGKKNAEQSHAEKNAADKKEAIAHEEVNHAPDAKAPSFHKARMGPRNRRMFRY
jgi:hypothetical protein